MKCYSPIKNTNMEITGKRIELDKIILFHVTQIHKDKKQKLFVFSYVWMLGFC